MALRERTRKAVAWPNSTRRKPIPKSTLYRWLKAYRGRGYQGLLPKVRTDRGAPRRAGTAAWVGYAIALLYEQPNRSLTQLEAYLKLEFTDYQLSRSALARHLRAHPACDGIAQLRKGHKSKDLWHGHERPNAQPGFGLPELFSALTPLLGRLVPESGREAHTVLGFYRKYGPLARQPFLDACARTAKSLGTGRPLSAYLGDLERQISAVADPVDPVDPDSQEDSNP